MAGLPLDTLPSELSDFSMNRKHIIAASALLFLVGFAVWFWPRSGPRATGAIPQDAYLWQRAWTEPVREVVSRHATNFSELITLSAEVVWKHGKPQVVRVPLRYDVLRQAGCRVGLALRIGPFSGPFAADDERARWLTDLTASRVREAKSNQLTVAELQLDFDCAESKLDGYRQWVQAVQRGVSPVPVTITALPSWLDRRAFRRLVQTADGFVLQVHSLERPQNAEAPFALCVPAAARRAVEKAAHAGRPFRVALPTYGYLMAFDETGKLVGLSAEGPSLSWPSGLLLREVRSDPAAMADLVQGWVKDRPALLRGILWYRLPVAGEELNWAWPALARVMTGQPPEPHLHPVVRHPKPGLVEVDLENRGTADFCAPARLRVQWKNARLVASDGVAGFETVPAGPYALEFRNGAAPVRFHPGQKQLIGWLRLETNVEVQVELSTHESQ